MEIGFARGEQGAEKINSISFNADCSFLGVATSIGFKIFRSEPLSLHHGRDLGTALQLIQLVERSNLVCLVGQKETAFTPPHRLVIFDDRSQKVAAELNFQSPIKQIRVRKGKVAVALNSRVFLLDLFTLTIEHVLATFPFQEDQPYNLISLSNDPTNLILAAPGAENGHLLLAYLSRLTERKIKAHQSILSAVLLTCNGEKVATASEKGIQIRVFDTRSGEMLQEVRRGNEFATIYSLAFSTQGNWLAVSSDSFNLHVFATKQTPYQKTQHYARTEGLENPKPLLFFLRKILPHFDAEYSFCSYKYQQYSPQMRTILAFGTHDDYIVSISNLQTYEKIQLNPQGGRCRTMNCTKNILHLLPPSNILRL